MPHAHHRPWIVLIIGVAIIALLLGVWVNHNTAQSRDAKTQVATVLSQPRQIENFKLTEDNGQSFTNANLKDHWSLIFFGFTRCPDLCPTTLSILNQAYQLMEKNHLTPMPRVVFISVDPEHDAADGVIKKYLSSFNPNFIGATGNKAELDRLTQNLSVLYMKVTNKNDNEHYMIDHSGTVLLINPKGDLAAIFSTPHQAAVMASDVSNIIKAQGKA